MPDHTVYNEDGEPVPWKVPKHHVKTWGWDSEAAIVGDAELGIDPAEWETISALESAEADKFFGGIFDEPS